MKIYASESEETYNSLYNDLQNVATAEFLKYYNENYHYQYQHLTCINRSSSYSLFQTNNATESIFKQLKSFLDNKSHSLFSVLNKINLFYKQFLLKKGKGLYILSKFVMMLRIIVIIHF